MNYKGVIIEESLENKDILKDVKILETREKGSGAFFNFLTHNILNSCQE